MMLELNVVTKEVSPRMTISPTRFELKLPTGTTDEVRTRYVKFAEEVCALLLARGPVTQTLRGRIRPSLRDVLYTQLKTDRKVVVLNVVEGKGLVEQAVIEAEREASRTPEQR